MNKFAAMQIGQFCLSLLAMASLCHCASKATPPGGARDEIPPAIVLDKSTINEQTQFSERSFIVTLNEWVKLEDAQNQILISPPLERRPEIKLKGKSVVFKFHEEEILKENTTYSINFGEAIQDITENNVLRNFSFVFSTGDIIDSLRVTGQVVEAFSGEPVKDATIMIYASLGDSVPLKEKPFYATKSNEEGEFEIRNMKEGTYKIVALVDENLNYLVDPNERMAFLDSSFFLGAAGVPSLNLMMSLPRPLLYADRIDTSLWNKAVITYNQSVEELTFSYEDPDETLIYDVLDQTLSIWYYSDNRREWPIYLGTPSSVDTLTLKLDSPSQNQTALKKLARLKNSAYPTDPFYICFDRPVVALENSQIFLYEGKTGRKELLASMDIIDSLPLCLQLSYSWQPDSSYELLILPGGLTDIYQLSNDSIQETFPIGNQERFGNIILNIEGLADDRTYIVELVIKDRTEKSFKLDSVSTYRQAITKLKPATYELRISEDLNRNGRWDPGDLLARRQPERTRKYEIEQLRANWDVEVNVKWTY